MTITPTKFRTDFPEFSDAENYSDAQVSFWLSIADRMLIESRWGDVVDQGRELFAAHNLVLGRQAMASSSAGGAPGIGSGLVASKSVDKVAVSYDTTSGIEPGAGHWNLTTYGTRFIWLANMMGAGGMQL